MEEWSGGIDRYRYAYVYVPRSDSTLTRTLPTVDCRFLFYEAHHGYTVRVPRYILTVLELE